jgi:hypothetical protein
VKRNRFYQVTIALIAVLAAGATFAAVRMHASAQTQAPAPQPGQTHRGKRVFGTIQSLSAGSFVVAGRDGKSYTVKTTAATKVLTATAGAPGDIKAGDAVRILARKAQDGSLTATAVQDAPAALGFGARGRGGVRDTNSGRVFVAGSVISVNGTTLSVASAGGTATTITVPASAKISRLTAVPLASLAAGAHVAAMGSLNPDGSLSAATIMVLAGPR